MIDLWKIFFFHLKNGIDIVAATFKQNPKIIVKGYSGLTINFCKSENAQVIVRGLRVFSDFELEFRMALANHRLDPEVEVVALITAEEHSFYHPQL